MSCAEELVRLAQRLEGFEVVPGVELPAPTFAPHSESIEELEGVRVPPAFVEFIRDPGAISAIDTAGGVAFFTPEQLREHLQQEYGDLLRSADGVSSFPFAATGSGSYLLLAFDDSAVWKFNVHMHPVAAPIRIANGFHAFLDRLIADWEAVLAGRGGPYSTS